MKTSNPPAAPRSRAVVLLTALAAMVDAHGSLWAGAETVYTVRQTYTVKDLPEKLREPAPGPSTYKLPPGGVVLEDLEQDLIRQALEESDGRIKEAADLLGLTYKTLQYRLKKHEIDRHAPEG